MHLQIIIKICDLIVTDSWDFEILVIIRAAVIGAH